MVIFYKTHLALLLLSVITCSFADSVPPFNRGDFKYHNYKAYSAVGFYTATNCSSLEVDHIVSFRDAYDSGAASWSGFKKALFANDRKNHVPACADTLILKAELPPTEFMLKARQAIGPDFKITAVCDYIARYYAIKTKYGLLFANNNRQTFADCGLTI